MLHFALRPEIGLPAMLFGFVCFGCFLSIPNFTEHLRSRSLTPPSVACERWMARLSPGPSSRCGTAGEDRGGGTAEMRMGGERGRSYKLRRNSGYLTPACLSSTINHAQELRCVLSLLWPSAALIHLHSFSCFFSLLR